MVNKRKFNIRNTKKVLHKVGKRWVVVSAVLLGLVAGGVAVTTANADTMANVSANAPVTAVGDNSSTLNTNAIKSKIEQYRQKGIMNETLNGIGNHIKPRMSNPASGTAYNNITSMASASNLAKLSNGESLGITSDASNANTWFGSLNNAESNANNLFNQSQRYKSIRDFINNQLNHNVGRSITLNHNLSIPMSTNDAESYIANALSVSNVKPSDKVNTFDNKVQNILNGIINSRLSQPINVIGQNIIPNKTNSIGILGGDITVGPFINKGINITSNSGLNLTTPPSTSLSHAPNVEIIASNDKPATITVPNETIADIINGNTSINVSGNALVSNLSGTFTNNYSGKVSISGEIDNLPPMGSRTVKGVLDSAIKSKLSNFKSNSSVKSTTYTFSGDYSFAPTTYTFSDIPITGKETLPTTKDITLSNRIVPVSALSNNSYSTSDIANILQDAIHPGQVSVGSGLGATVNSEISTQISSLANQYEPAKATSYINDAINAINAGDQMISSASMSASYNDAVSDLANLANDNESGEQNDLSKAAKAATSLAKEYGTASGSVSFANSLLNRAANAASFAATSMSNDADQISNDSTSANADSSTVQGYSTKLNILTADAGTKGLMNNYINDINSQISTINSAKNVYDNFADPSDGNGLTNANNALSKINKDTTKAKALLNSIASKKHKSSHNSKASKSHKASLAHKRHDASLAHKAHEASINSKKHKANHPVKPVKPNTPNHNGGNNMPNTPNTPVNPVNPIPNIPFVPSTPVNPFTPTPSSASSGANPSVAPSSVASDSANSVSPNSQPTYHRTNKDYRIQHNYHNSGNDVVTYHGHEYDVHYHNNGKNTIRIQHRITKHGHHSYRYHNIVVSLNLPTPHIDSKTTQMVDRINFDQRGKRIFTKYGIIRAINSNKPGKVFNYRGHKFAAVEVPGHFRFFMVRKDSRVIAFGKNKSKLVLKPNHLLTIYIDRIFVVHGRHANYVRYEIRLHHHNYWVAGRDDFVPNSYWQSSDLKSRHSHRIQVINNCELYTSYIYNSRTHIKGLKRGTILHVKKVINLGRKANYQTRFILTNGDFVTANKNFVRIYK